MVDFFRKKMCGLFGGNKFSAFLCELQKIARMLVFFATVGLFLYALIFPHFWIILILFMLFLALLALSQD
ncbi:hypothetical protein [Dehalobacterium formicoaceticum]|uniref:Uncharacterized protein n=1 Tax=Dehalobacterium formicoaceticum TaxID=51515 RepID=A0ABT1Y0N9_9FIRM|nr:hypothetical protein [Dehalobacterium formicoaceticum]MCR6544118.1 hypothetical protein [Dehalobacterium formicoaceticum]